MPAIRPTWYTFSIRSKCPGIFEDVLSHYGEKDDTCFSIDFVF